MPLRCFVLVLLSFELLTSIPAQAKNCLHQSQAGTVQKSAETRALAAGDTVERELAEGDAHSYRIALGEGQYVRLVVEQRSVDLSAKLFGSDGRQIFEANNPNGTGQPEIVSLVSQKAGDYRVEVSAVLPSGKGRYVIRVVEMRAATPEDNDHVTADRLFAEAERLGARTEEQSQRRALEKYNESLPLWHSLNDRLMEATTLVNIGLAEQNLGQSHNAIAYYERALPTLRELHHKRGEAQTLNNIGWAYTFLGESDKALNYYLQAVSLRRDLEDRRGEAQTLINIGTAYKSLGEPETAVDNFNRGLAIARSLGDLGLEAYSLNNLSSLYLDIDEPQKAFDYLTATIPIWRKTGNNNGEAQALNILGMIYHDLGDFENALERFSQSLKLWQLAGSRHAQAQVLNNIGTVYHDLGEFQKALDYYGRSLPLRQAAGDRLGEAATLGNTGLTYLRLGEPAKTLDYINRALPLYRASRDVRGEAIALDNLGSAWIELGEWDKALENFEEALRLSRVSGLRQLEASVLAGLARANRGRGKLIEARIEMEAALSIIESVRARVGIEKLRASFFANKQVFYEFYISLLIDMQKKYPSEHFDVAALEANERARARSLLDLLAESSSDIREGTDPDLLARERELRQRLNGKDSYRIRLMGGKHNAEQVADLEKQIAEGQTEYQNLQAQIRKSSPRYAALTQPTLVSLKDIQLLLDDGTMLLEYSIGKSRSLLWTVTSNTFASFELPGRATLEQAARQTYQLLTVSHRRQHRREAERAAAELSQMLLGPVADNLAKKRLLVVADGILHYVPFAALPMPAVSYHRSNSVQSDGPPSADHQPTTAGYRPLIVDHEIINLPSASVLALLRREAVNRKAPDKVVAVFADPILRNGDERIKQGATEKPSDELPGADRAGPADLSEAVRDPGFTGLERLPFAVEEAEAILSLAGEQKSLKAVGYKASFAFATSPELADYRIVHFATHGLINSTHPELSGLVLSLFDEQGRSQNGFLRAQDVYNLKLRAELVVLSSCRTALGRQVRGEGLVGLVRAFIYAGAPRVVASLWDVKDRATADLMKGFYRRMLIEGMRPAAALRAAQLDMWKQERWREPYYWAGFVLQGEWR